MFDEYEYGDMLRLALNDGSTLSGEFYGTDDADETPLEKDYVDIYDGTFHHSVHFDDIASVERVS